MKTLALLFLLSTFVQASDSRQDTQDRLNEFMTEQEYNQYKQRWDAEDQQQQAGQQQFQTQQDAYNAEARAESERQFEMQMLTIQLQAANARAKAAAAPAPRPLKPVTDPAILAILNSTSTPKK